MTNLEIEISQEDLPIILEKIGHDNYDKIEVFGINDDGSKEKINLYEFVIEQKKNLPS